jgi:hypothetical protein
MARGLGAINAWMEHRKKGGSAMKQTAFRLVMGVALPALVVSGWLSPSAAPEPTTATPMLSGRVDVGGYSLF